jgi:hypothetical protein
MSDTENVKQVQDCGNSYDANQYLKLGWKLHQTYASSAGVRYVVVWKGDGDAPRPQKLAAQHALEALDAELAKIKAQLGDGDGAQPGAGG